MKIQAVIVCALGEPHDYHFVYCHIDVNKYFFFINFIARLYAVRCTYSIDDIAHDICIEIDFKFEINVQANHINCPLSESGLWTQCVADICIPLLK